MAKFWTETELEAIGIHRWTPEEIEADLVAFSKFTEEVSRFAKETVSSKAQKDSILREWSQGFLQISMPECVERYLSKEPEATRCCLEITYIKTVEDMQF